MNFKRHVVVYGFMLIGFKVTGSTISDRRYCGYQHIDDYVRPNENISIDEFPWMAQLVYDDDQKILCGGSLISSRHVLTAAHCVKTPDYNLTMIRLGDHNIKTVEDCVTDRGLIECSDPVEQFQIKERIVHPFYNWETSENDIALLELSHGISFSDYIRPICLPDRNSSALTNSEQLLTSGWGMIGVGLEQTDLKKRIMAKLITNEECKNFYKYQKKLVTNNHMCAIEVGKSITCLGDSGSPLMYSVKTQWELVGILIFGLGCGNIYPAVYTKVSSYLDWIEEQIHPKKFNSNLYTDTIIFPS